MVERDNLQRSQGHPCFMQEVVAEVVTVELRVQVVLVAAVMVAQFLVHQRQEPQTEVVVEVLLQT
jgi:hypothetical protein